MNLTSNEDFLIGYHGFLLVIMVFFDLLFVPKSAVVSVLTILFSGAYITEALSFERLQVWKVFFNVCKQV